MAEAAYQICVNAECKATYDVGEVLFACRKCGSLLDVAYDFSRVRLPRRLSDFELRWSKRKDPLNLSGVWRFRELIPFAKKRDIVTIGEGQTLLIEARESLAKYVGLEPGRFFLQYEGLNPSGSFKDNGMTGALTHARMVGAKSAICASTGNTASSLALFAAASGALRAIVFIGKGKIAHGKLAQILDHGAKTLQIEGDFDDAMQKVQEVATDPRYYLVNSLNPFRLEGQKAIMFRILESLGWRIPRWIVLPGGNLGNTSAFGKAFQELYELGLIRRKPHLAAINSTGANTFYQIAEKKGIKWNKGKVDEVAIKRYYQHMDERGIRAKTIASAIEINRPVNLIKALRSLEWTRGLVRQVPDEEIFDAKAQVGKGGLGCEPASAAAVAGVRRLRREGIIGEKDLTVALITGHLLKDLDATVGYHTTPKSELPEVFAGFKVKRARFQNRPIPVANDLEAILRALKK
ncbi:MAG: threonine synthase [Planctomycetes bacterium DG_23]|nr:MAG: threonine synthase [Planctomycetes bacterium DG_23]